jgi:flagellar basal-body rod protein FlgB
MNVNLLHDQTLEAASSYLGRLSQRYQILSSNLANIDTPGYKTKDIPFHATMQELLSDESITMRSSRPEHSGQWTPVQPQTQVFEVPGLPAREGSNNVDLDKELVKLSETTFGYSVMSQMVRSKLHIIASSIAEGRV